MTKPDCYKCKYRGNVPGDAHSCCNHPIVKKAMEKEGLMVFMAMIMAGVARPMLKGLDVKGNPHGIKNGWFCWPFNFDPTWLEECSGFTEREDDNKKREN